MTRAGVAAVIGVFILTAQGVAPAQTVPMPKPAPKASAAPAAAAKPATPSLADSINTEAGQHALVDRVSLYLSTVQTLVGNFVQVGPDGRKTEGKFYIRNRAGSGSNTTRRRRSNRRRRLAVVVRDRKLRPRTSIRCRRRRCASCSPTVSTC